VKDGTQQMKDELSARVQNEPARGLGLGDGVRVPTLTTGRINGFTLCPARMLTGSRDSC